MDLAQPWKESRARDVNSASEPRSNKPGTKRKTNEMYEPLTTQLYNKYVRRDYILANPAGVFYPLINR